jgi:hypothetical protein
MKTHTFIICDISKKAVIKQVNFKEPTISKAHLRTEARKAAGFVTASFTLIWDEFGNDIMYNRKSNGFVYVVDEARLAAGDYLRNPLSILDNPAALAAARTRNKSRIKRGERPGKNYHADRTAEALKIHGLNGETVTTANCHDLRDYVRRQISEIRREQTILWERANNDAAKLAEREAELVRQREALTAYIRLHNPGKEAKVRTFTADQITLATPENLKAYAPPTEELAHTQVEEISPEDCDFI